MKRVFSTIVFLVIALLFSGCSLEEWYCPQEELRQYLIEADDTAATFMEKGSEANNYPERKTEILKELGSITTEYQSLEIPACAQKHKKMIIEAMDASLKFLSPERDRYYEKSELSLFAYEKWQSLGEEKVRLTDKYLTTDTP